MSAISNIVESLARRIPVQDRLGRRFLQGETVYVHTNNVMAECMEELGLEAALKVDTTNPENVRKALEDHIIRDDQGNIVVNKNGLLLE